jgi:hypothetical protein
VSAATDTIMLWVAEAGELSAATLVKRAVAVDLVADEDAARAAVVELVDTGVLYAANDGDRGLVLRLRSSDPPMPSDS